MKPDNRSGPDYALNPPKMSPWTNLFARIPDFDGTVHTTHATEGGGSSGTRPPRP